MNDLEHIYTLFYDHCPGQQGLANGQTGLQETLKINEAVFLQPRCPF